GGRLDITSEKGKGTTVEMWFPAAANEKQAVVAQPKVQNSAMSRPLTVLAVDDDSLVLMGTGAMLEDLGHTVHEAVSGLAALEILRKTPEIEIVITDQAMPKMTGLALAEQIHKEFPGLPVVIATGYAELSSRPVDLLMLNKPFLQADLATILNAAMALTANTSY